uniref:Uncharacterized protein n=1 Tax=Pipistrellus kuhlii TaxID=59472 RepID=A0A7J7TPK1_PIPKU|nr:hypothetical protein mPipKuh1_009316 [Pipistrellus kuhlii]
MITSCLFTVRSSSIPESQASALTAFGLCLALCRQSCWRHHQLPFPARDLHSWSWCCPVSSFLCFLGFPAAVRLCLWEHRLGKGDTSLSDLNSGPRKPPWSITEGEVGVRVPGDRERQATLQSKEPSAVASEEVGVLPGA